MLKQLSRWERTSKYIVIIFAALMAISLVIFYAPGRSSGGNVDPTRNTEVVAKVGSASITVADVARIRENYAQMFGNRINLAQLGGNKRFLDGLISKQVIAQEAARLGLSASELYLIAQLEATNPLRTLQPGQELTFKLTRNGDLHSLYYPHSLEQALKVSR